MTNGTSTPELIRELRRLLSDGRLTGEQIANALLDGVMDIQADRARMRTALETICHQRCDPQAVAREALQPSSASEGQS